MPRLFDSFVMVNWSAASKPATGKDSIWIGALVPDARLRLTFRASNPPTRQAAYEQLKELLTRLTNRGDRVLLGFDFPFGFPNGTSEKLGLKAETPFNAIGDFLNKEMKDKPDNTNNRFALAARMNRLISDGPFPFWGCPKRDELTTLSVKKAREHSPEDMPEFRQTETAMIAKKLGRPQPVWKIAYAGAVGGQTMTGLPYIHKLRDDFADMKLWPFELPLAPLDTETLGNTSIVATEIYPAMIELKVIDTEIRDETIVRIIAEYYADLDEKDRLSPLFAGPEKATNTEKTAISTEEGWILGV
ncbi:cobalamin biosynthesis protein CbiG [Hirschia litorea]|uniref:Cobalamin biosynthesis protein CbiG n=1 Tax=Hirschia litorea TaxID=1199156 RepID=A0ABW2IID2_9PROT